jgi:dihydrofolate synthase/folylpolyglutamate synthase
VAIALLREIDRTGVAVGRSALRAAVTDVRWPGRLEEFTFRGARVLLDAAHNPAGARALAAFLEATGWTGCALVFASMQDKDAAAMLAALAPVCSAVVCTTPPTPRATPAEPLAAIARTIVPKLTVEAIPDPAAALARACSLSSRVAAAGSIFLIGPLRDILPKP